MSVRGTDGQEVPPLEEGFLLAIGAQNDFLHAYPDAQTLIAERDVGAGVGEQPLALEFFDSHGQRYAGRYDPEWRLLGLVPSADPPDPEQLRRRVEGVGDYMRHFIEQHRDVVELYGLTQEEALAVFPAPIRSRALVDAVRPFTAASGGDEQFPTGAFGDEDDQGIIHNLIHHGHP
jgi:hypothetical protein